MDPWLTLGTASALGLLHALELDHMVAVSAFVAQRPSPRAAAGFGARWGIGHSAAVLSPSPLPAAVVIPPVTPSIRKIRASSLANTNTLPSGSVVIASGPDASATSVMTPVAGSIRTIALS